MGASSVHVPVTELPDGLPRSEIPSDADLSSLPALVKQYLNDLSPKDLVENAIWRDWLSLTGGVRTLYGSVKIAEVWKKLSSNVQAKAFEVIYVSIIFQLAPGGLAASASGTVALVPSGTGGWMIWTMTTILESFDGEKHPDKLQIQRSLKDSISIQAIGTFEVLAEEETSVLTKGTPNLEVESSKHQNSDVYEVAIIGSGQHGLCLAGRLQALEIPYIVFERNPEVGDNWLNRYDSVRLHTPRETNNLPFAPTWSADDPLYLPRNTIAEGHRRFVDRYNINVRTSMTVEQCIWDEKLQLWTVLISRGGSQLSFKAKQVALATGGGYGTPKWPEWPGKELYKGTLMHSTMYKNCEGWRGKRAVIIGTGTSAHDIARDMVEAGVSVTMVQRRQTAVFPKEWSEGPMVALWNPNIPTELSDRAGNALPYKIIRDMSVATASALKQAEQDKFDALERVGFKVDRKSELFDLILEKLGGYYLDVGTSDLIRSGAISIKSGVTVAGYTSSGLAFSDGTELPADIILVATGFDVSYDKQLGSLFGREVAERAGSFWGLDGEGELRGLLKHFGGYPLWLCGGGATQARWHSRFMALHIQASVLGKPLERSEF